MLAETHSSPPPPHRPNKQSPGREAHTDCRKGRAATRYTRSRTESASANRASPPLPSLPTLPFPPPGPAPPTTPAPGRSLRRSCPLPPPPLAPPRPSFPPLLLPCPAFLSLVDFSERSRLGAIQLISPLPRPPSSFLPTPPISARWRMKRLQWPQPQQRHRRWLRWGWPELGW